MTDFYAFFHKYGPSKAKELETQQGITMANAAAATPTLEHYIWSTLPNGTKDYPVPHFEGKHSVDGFIKQDAALLAKTTFFIVCIYTNNRQLASFRPYWLPTVKKYVQFTTYPPETPIHFIGDVCNVMPFVKAIVEKPEQTRDGAVVIGAVASMTAKEWVEAWVRERGEEVQMVSVARDVYDELFPWPRWAEEFAPMMGFFESVPVEEWFEGKVVMAGELGVVPAVTMEEWARTYELPDASESTI